MTPRWIVAVAAAGALSGEAAASGFAIREQSSSFQGLSFAGVAAGGGDISTMYFNPATLALHEGEQAHLSLSYVLPSAEFRLDEATDGLGNPLSGGEGGDIADAAVIPATYAMISFDDLRFGLGVTAPFGLRTEQPRDWVGRYHATESALKTININPVVAYAISDRLAVAGGVVVQYADATLAQAVFTGGADGIGEVKGTDWDVGFTLGVLAEPIDGTRIGLGYRSQINHSLDGDFEVAVNGSVVSATGGRAPLSTPQVASLGIRQRLSDRVDVLGTVEWTGWSSFDELRIAFDDGRAPSVTPENWRDTWFFALGTEYRPRDDVALQVGIAYDQTPIRDGFRTPRIPGNNRTWFSVGAMWDVTGRLSLGAGYSYIWVEDGEVDLDGGSLAGGGRGTLRGSFENRIDILAVHGTLRF